jgi:hypothetical protein
LAGVQVSNVNAEQLREIVAKVVHHLYPGSVLEWNPSMVRSLAFAFEATIPTHAVNCAENIAEMLMCRMMISTVVVLHANQLQC